MSDMDIMDRLREQSRRVAELYGDPEPPDGEMKPADQLWFTVQEAVAEIENLRTTVDVDHYCMGQQRLEIERLEGVIGEYHQRVRQVIRAATGAYVRSGEPQ